MNNNNAKAILQTPIVDVNATEIPIPSGRIGLFSNTFPYPITYEKSDNTWKVTWREVMLCTGKNGDNLVVTRRYEFCPVNDDAITQTKTPIVLEAEGIIEARVTSAIFDEIYWEIDSKLDGVWFTTDAEGLNYANRLDVNKFTYRGAVRPVDGYDLNNLTDAWFYCVFLAVNSPVAWIVFITVERHEGDSYGVHQTLTTYWVGNTPNQIYSRVHHSGTTWTSWEKLITGGVPKLSALSDVRGNNKNPNQYNNQFNVEFSDGTTLWISWGVLWGQLVTMNAWTDTTGQVYQFFYSQEWFYTRKSTSDTTWDGWLRYDSKVVPVLIQWTRTHSAAAGVVTIAHNFKSRIKSVEAICVSSNSMSKWWSIKNENGTYVHNCTYETDSYSSGTGNATMHSIVSFPAASNNYSYCSITFDDTNIYMDWQKLGSPSGTAYFTLLIS